MFKRNMYRAITPVPDNTQDKYSTSRPDSRNICNNPITRKVRKSFFSRIFDSAANCGQTYFPMAEQGLKRKLIAMSFFLPLSKIEDQWVFVIVYWQNAIVTFFLLDLYFYWYLIDQISPWISAKLQISWEEERFWQEIFTRRYLSLYLSNCLYISLTLSTYLQLYLLREGEILVGDIHPRIFISLSL